MSWHDAQLNYIFKSKNLCKIPGYNSLFQRIPQLSLKLKWMNGILNVLKGSVKIHSWCIIIRIIYAFEYI